VHGWPQTWYAWRMLMPALARDFSVVAVDQRRIGLSDKPQDGYDTATLARDLVALMDALGHPRFALYGTDTGMPIAYALAADHPDRVDRLVVSEAPLPGISPSPPLFLPPLLNARLWHLAFNQLPAINEQLVTGREDIFFGAEFDASAGTHKLPDDAVKYYIDTLASDPDHLRGSFGFYRAIPATIAQPSGIVLGGQQLAGQHQPGDPQQQSRPGAPGIRYRCHSALGQAEVPLGRLQRSACQLLRRGKRRQLGIRRASPGRERGEQLMGGGGLPVQLQAVPVVREQPGGQPPVRDRLGVPDRVHRVPVPGEPARHADDPPRGRADPGQSRPDHVASADWSGPQCQCPVPSSVSYRRPR
jgi:pimeloyl-ACP methyl ester carboxylesterase